MKHYHDYGWKQGRPYGINPCKEDLPLTYAIVSDPYHKRYSIEQYKSGAFEKIVYDSALFDFRHLKIEHQIAWQKSLVSETATRAVSHIRNQDGRLTVVEVYTFESERCRECRAFSPHGILLSVQKVSYVSFKDPFNGVSLYDSNEHPVMLKKYSVHKDTGEFTDILHEQWENICNP